MNEPEPIADNTQMTLAMGMATAMLCILFGANAVAIKVSLTGLGVFTAAGLRFGMAAAVIFAWARLTGRPLGVARDQWRHLALLSVIFSVQLSLFYLGISRSNASRATLLVNLQPLFVLLLAHFFIPGDRINLRKTAGILMGFAGVAFVFMEKRGAGANLLTGDLIILAATVIWGINAVYVKRILNNLRPFQVVAYPMAVSVPVFMLEGLAWDDPMVFDLSARVTTALLYQSLVTASFGFVAWITLLKRYGAVALHAFIFIMPIAGVFLGGILLGEPITGNIVVSLVLIVSGILITHFRQRHRVPPLPLGRNV